MTENVDIIWKKLRGWFESMCAFGEESRLVWHNIINYSGLKFLFDCNIGENHSTWLFTF